MQPSLSNYIMASVIVETEYAAELAGARLRLAALKERAAKRARLRGDTVPQPADKDALAGQHPNGGLGERHSTAQAQADAKPAGAALQRLIAAMLLDAATAVPMDSAKLHREVRSLWQPAATPIVLFQNPCHAVWMVGPVAALLRNAAPMLARGCS